jgi:hypothetical protein
MSQQTHQQCQFKKSNGGGCRATPMTGQEYCFFHDPTMAMKRTKARSAGGRKNKAAVLSTNLPELSLKNVADVVSLLAATVNQVRHGELHPKFANSIGYLSGILLKALETEDIEARINSLERAIATQKRQGWPLDDNNEYSFVSDSTLERR